MKRLFVITLAILVTMIFVSVALADEPLIQLPTATQAALDKALADPPVSPEFLWNVGTDAKVWTLLKAAPIVVKLDTLNIYFSSETNPQLVLANSCGTMLQSSEGTIELGCKGDSEVVSCCTEIGTILAANRESDFWKAFEEAIRIEKKKVVIRIEKKK
jgi:hypothetical protein